MLNRSQEVKEKIEDTQHLPQRTEEQKDEKKEAAKLLRMETWLDNASIIIETTDTLKTNPLTTKNELIESLKNSKNITHPERVEGFVEAAATVKDDIAEAVDYLEQQHQGAKEELGREAYKTLFAHFLKGKDEGLPKGKIRLTTNYPFALVLETEDRADFDAIDSRTNVGANYIEKLGLGNNQIPVIIYGPNQGGRLSGHEEGHADHGVLRESLSKPVIKAVWGSILTRRADKDHPKHPRAKLKNIFDTAQTAESWTKVTQTEDWEDVETWALSEAKDELLAEMNQSGGNVNKHLFSLEISGGTYDFFQQLGVMPGLEIHKRLFKDYREKLKENSKEAVELFNFYNTHVEWSHRFERFRLVLAQIPLQEWKTQIERSLFVQEKDSYQVSEAYIQSARSVLTIDKTLFPNATTSDEEVALYKAANNLGFERGGYLIQNSQKPVYKELKEFAQAAEELEVKALQTVTGRLNLEAAAYKLARRELRVLIRTLPRESMDTIEDKMFDIEFAMQERVVGHDEKNIDYLREARFELVNLQKELEK